VTRPPNCRLFLFSEDKKGGQFFYSIYSVLSKQTETFLGEQPTLSKKKEAMFLDFIKVI